MNRSSSFQCGAVILGLCGLGIVFNLWTTDSIESDRIVVKEIEATDFASRKLEFYAAVDNIGNGEDVGATDKPINGFDGECQVPRFDDVKQPPEVTCKRPPPTKGSCESARLIFHNEPTPTCSHQETYEICRLEKTAEGYNVNCTNDICTSDVSLGIIDPLIGALKWTQIETLQLLENAIALIMSKDEGHGNYGFCYLKCSPQNVTSNTTLEASQLLLVPRNMSKYTCTNETICKDGVNINVIWLDSTSHSHFYRSMPESIANMRKIRENKDAFVFNYNLMQSMAGGTYVNTVAFTSGKTVSRATLLKNRTPIGDLFNLFKKGGYHVNWMDDLCWHWSMENCACGIPKFLGIVGDKKKRDYAKSWDSFQTNLRKKGVDQIGMSLANCEIMRANNITDPFQRDKKAKVAICYNGYDQTHYLLSTMEMMQTQLASVGRPLFQFLDLNLGHEATGRRIQTLDKSLAKFINFLSKQDNTLTLMFGDHGNKYGKFVQASKEAKIEMAHTILFAVVSRNLKEKLGLKKIEALEINQNRMVNIFDLRNTILTLAPGKITPDGNKKYDNHPEGLFHAISPNRTCKSMGILPEAAKCICQEDKATASVSNDTHVTVIADFALGVINNMLQEQYIEGNPNRTSTLGNCRRLARSFISEVQETLDKHDKKVATYDMNIILNSGYNSPNTEDAFSVVIKVTKKSCNISLMELVHYERITTYAVYDDCRDQGVNGDVCICDLASPTGTQGDETWHSLSQDSKLSQHVSISQMTTGIGLDDCLFIYERRTHYGLVLEASCECWTRNYEILIQIVKQFNVVTSKSHPVTIQVKSRTIVFLCTFHQAVLSKPWNVVYDITFRQL